MGQVESFSGKPTPANEQALEVVATLINEIQPGAMVQKFVLLVETIDGEDRWLSTFAAPGQKAWDTMGMLQYALTFEANFQAHSEADEDIDPED
jgi:hypothetical protein